MTNAFSDFRQDLRYALRTMRNTPGLTVIAVLALALGIGANTAIFSVVNAVLLRSLPYPEPERLVALSETNVTRNLDHDPISPGIYQTWRRDNHVFSDLAATFTLRRNLSAPGEPEEIRVQQATASLFRTLGVVPMLGRTYTDQEDVRGGPELVVLSHRLWVRRFGSNPNAIGMHVTLGGRSAEVIGVMPAQFRTIDQGSDEPPEAWAPFRLPANIDANAFNARFMSVVARLAPGVTPERARAELNVIHTRMQQQFPVMNTGFVTNVVPLHEELAGALKKPLFVLFAAVAVVLLIACANVANLLLARAAVRHREIAIRLSLGARRARLIRMLLSETVLMALCAGVVGILLAMWGIDLLVAIAPTDLRLRGAVSADARVFLFNFAVAVATGLLFGIAPAFAATRDDTNTALRQGTRSSGHTMTARVRNALVVGEVACGIILLAGAGLLIRSLVKLESINPGFHAEQLYAARIGLPETQYPDPQRRWAFFRALLERVRATPGIEATSLVGFVPFGNGFQATGLSFPDQPPAEAGHQPVVMSNAVDANYFATMRIPILAGRGFDSRDRSDSARAYIVDRKFAETHFPGQSPIGRKIVVYMFDDQPGEIVGVAGDVHQVDLTTVTPPMVYYAFPQTPFGFGSLVLRSKLDSAVLARSVGAAVRSLDRSLPPPRVEPVEALVAESIARARFLTMLLTVFAGCALVLAATGLYGVIAYAVAQRTQEIGIRMALGARTVQIARMVLTEGLRTTAIGLVGGLAGALVLSRVIKTLLYETQPTDPFTYMVICGVLIVVSLTAAYIPARRATRVEPVEALRYE